TDQGLEVDMIASALLANGVRNLLVHEECGRPRAIYCTIGPCFECRLTVTGTPGVRACVTPLQEGMVIESGRVEPRPFDSANNSNKMPRTYAEFAKGGDADA